jgi:hypothetical protein
MTGRIKYEFSGNTWQYPSPGGWHFISVPKELSKEIRGILRSEEEGWGRLKATAKIGGTEWKTAIWFDTKMNIYLLPVKAEVRKKEKIETGKEHKVIIWI